ncbi:MAG: sulfotransferase [Gammaproteobacteria bacterium]|nr:sulfotransferase [Gammaproteobacteria bacterium]
MLSDPHDAGQRLPEYAKDADSEHLLLQVNQACQALPLAWHVPAEIAELPLIYVVGAPRSGTTLLAQVLIHALRLGYIDNIVARFYLRPLVGVVLSRAVLGADAVAQTAFDSRHGVTREPAGHHEFGYFWRHWLKLDAQPTHRLDTVAREHIDVRALGDTLRHELLGGFGLPVLFKNVICGLNAQLLAHAHPNALFINIVREAGPACRSILAARKARYGRFDSWWSVKPSNFPEIEHETDPAVSVVRQYLGTLGDLDEELSGLETRRLDVSYEQLIRSPQRVIELVRERLGELGHLPALRREPLPDLHMASGALLPPALCTSVDRALAEHADRSAGPRTNEPAFDPNS